MKTFDQLEFIQHKTGEGERACEIFSNGYGVSVVKSKFSYGGAYGYYQLAVIDENENIAYGNPILDDDVIGWLTPTDVTDVMKKIQEYQV